VAGIDAVLARHGLGERQISLRITGCPNGCCRSYSGDIGMVGRMPGFYALYVGGDFAGTRLSFKLLEKVEAAEVVPTLAPLLGAWAEHGTVDEGFGDYCTRVGLDGLLAMLPRAEAAAA